MIGEAAVHAGVAEFFPHAGTLAQRKGPNQIFPRSRLLQCVSINQTDGEDGVREARIQFDSVFKEWKCGLTAFHQIFF